MNVVRFNCAWLRSAGIACRCVRQQDNTKERRKVGRGELGTASSLQALRDLSRSACARSSSHVAPHSARVGQLGRVPRQGRKRGRPTARAAAHHGIRTKGSASASCGPRPLCACPKTCRSHPANGHRNRRSPSSSRHGARSRSNRARPARWTPPWQRTPPGSRTPEKNCEAGTRTRVHNARNHALPWNARARAPSNSCKH